jgi:type I restriction enzyme S subunit
MLWDGERSGLVGHGQAGVVASTVNRLSPSGEVGGKFLYYALANQFEWIQNRRTGSGVPHVPKEIGRILRVRYPRCPQTQQRIAAILTSIDNAIEATEALIDKHRQIKAGLMHDLFTRGVLQSGDLRPSHREQPSAYGSTSLGQLPVGWSVETLANLLAPVANNIRSGPFGSALLKDELSESGVPLLGIDNIHVERFERSYTRFVSQRKVAAFARYKVRPGDVVITIMGTVGRCCVLPEDIGVALSSKHLWTMTFDPERVLADLVCWQLNHAPWARAWFRRGSQGGIMEAIQSSTLKSLSLQLPPMDEQRRIRDRYLAMQAAIQSELEKLLKLRAQKLGLMQDLLTGKVRVPLPEPEVTA